MIGDRYYYGKLPENERKIYQEIYKGCVEHKDVIQISASEDMKKSYSRIIQALMDDNPLLYYLNQSTIEFAQDAYGNTAVLPQYFFPVEKVAVYNQRLQNAVNRIIFELKLTEGTDLEKVRRVHDYLCRNITYDYQGSDTGEVTRVITSHNVLGVFAYKKAQCEGISKAAKVLLNAVDVRCIVLFGKAADETGKMTDHSWNIVNVEGQPYHMDITFDIGNSSENFIAYDYYNISDAQIRKDHIFSTGLPKCVNKEANYFVQESLVFTSKRKLESYIAKQIADGSKMLYFKLAGKLKVREISNDLATCSEKAFVGHGEGQVTVDIVANEPVNTCRMIFT